MLKVKEIEETVELAYGICEDSGVSLGIDNIENVLVFLSSSGKLTSGEVSEVMAYIKEKAKAEKVERLEKEPPIPEFVTLYVDVDAPSEENIIPEIIAEKEEVVELKIDEPRLETVKSRTPEPINERIKTIDVGKLYWEMNWWVLFLLLICLAAFASPVFLVGDPIIIVGSLMGIGRGVLGVLSLFILIRVLGLISCFSVTDWLNKDSTPEYFSVVWMGSWVISGGLIISSAISS